MTLNRPGRRWIGAASSAGLLGLVACLAGGCSTAASGETGGPGTASGPVPSAYATPGGTDCGTARTIANTPVVIKVTKGSVACATAVTVENQYTAALKDGAIKGNGGGAPVTVSGWMCQGYPTPQVLKNGVTSECHTASADVVAVLDLPASAAPPSPSPAS